MSIFDELADTDFDEVDLNPILPVDKYEFTVVGMEKKISKRTGGEYIEITAALNQDATSVGGRQISPGYQVRHIMSLEPTEKMDKESIKANVAKFMLAVLGEPHWDPTFEAYKQQTFIAQVGIQDEQTDENTGNTYPAKNVFNRFLPKA